MMTKQRSTLSADEKAVLRHSRTLGLPIAIALLRREIERQPGAAQPHDDDQVDAGVDQARQLLPDRAQRTGYVTK